ncbi:MAG: YdbH domain-containing protein [Desulfotalea sp.]
MKKTAFFLVIITCLSFLYILAPHIANKISNKYLEPRRSSINIDHISPRQSSGSFTLSDDNINIILPRFTGKYQFPQLSRREISSLDIQGGSIFISKRDKEIKEVSSNNSQKLFLEILDNLPLTIKNIRFDKLYLSIEELDINILLSGSLQIKTSANNKKLLGITATIDVSGDLHSKIEGEFTSTEDDYFFTLRASNSLTDFNDILKLPQGNKLLGNLSSKVNFKISKDLNTHAFSAIISGNPQINSSAFGINLKSEPVTINITGDNKKISITTSQIKAEAQVPLVFNASASFEPATNAISSDINMKLGKGHNLIRIISQGDLKTIISEISLHDNAVFKNIKMKNGAKIKISTSIGPDKIIAKVTGKIKSITSTELRLTNLSLTETISLENGLISANGQTKISGIIFQNENIASLVLQNAFSNNDITFNGKVTSTKNNKIKIKCQGNYNLDKQGQGNCNLKSTEISEFDLPKFIHNKAPDELKFSAQLALNSTFTLKSKPQISTKLTITNGKMNIGDTLSASDINTSITIPSLLQQQSYPSQNLSISKIEVGAVNIADLNIDYHIENFHTIFLEKSRFKWAGGLVETNSARIDTNKKKQSLTLYCDRLSLTKILAQFGMPDASGDSSLNGRLPITLDSGKLYFDDGFLFSSPGDSGIVKFSNTENLREMIGSNKDLPYMDYSMSAMANFQYNWASLNFKTQEDELLIAMNLDGKPASPLPYAYKNGQIVYKEDGDGMQHPLRLSVNFKLPLTEMLRYGQTFKDILNQQ